MIDKDFFENEDWSIRIRPPKSKARMLEREILEFIKDILSSKGFIKSYNASPYGDSLRQLKNMTQKYSPIIKQVFSSFFVMKYNNGEIYFASCEKNLLEIACKIQKGYGSSYYSEVLHDREVLDAVHNTKNRLSAYEKLDLNFNSSVENVIKKIGELVNKLS